MRYALFGMAGIVAILIGYWLLTRRTRKPPVNDRIAAEPRHLTPQAQLVKLKDSPVFWGYRIESHCRPSSRLAGRQYPLDELPPLPVEGCTSGQCECCLVGLADQRRLVDRRSGQDRRRTLRLDSNDRRGDRPRRKADLNTWGSYGHL